MAGGIGIGSILSAVSAIGSMFFSSSASAPAPPPMPQFTPAPTPPSIDDEEIQTKAKEEAIRRSRASGLSSTVLTGGSGVEDDALTNKKTLLGS